jgi:hypothetical protein
MKRGYIRKTAAGGAKLQRSALLTAGVKVIYEDDRDTLMKSLRPGDAVVVARLSCLATSKEDLRWALTGRDDRASYKGAFIRGATIIDLEFGVLGTTLDQMPAVESVLRATEDWAKERRGIPRADSVKHGKRGGRPKKKRTDKHVAQKVWLDLVKYPKMADALAHPDMKGWSQSAATRHPPKGLGPRGALAGRHPKPR